MPMLWGEPDLPNVRMGSGSRDLAMRLRCEHEEGPFSIARVGRGGTS